MVKLLMPFANKYAVGYAMTIGYTLLQVCRSAEIMQMLLEHFGNAHVNAFNHVGGPPLSWQANSQHVDNIDAAKLLITYGAYMPAGANKSTVAENVLTRPLTEENVHKFYPLIFAQYGREAALVMFAGKSPLIYAI